MREDFDLLAFMLGLPTGLAVTLIIGYFIWRKGKKTRRYDERYKSIQDQAKSLSWAVTQLAIVIAWAIVIIVEGPGLAFFLFTAVYVIAMVSYGVAAAAAEKKN